MRGNGNNEAGRLAAAAIHVQPDSRLVGLHREGQDVAFEEIVRRYRARLVSLAAAIVPVDRAEDVVQEALTKAHGALSHSDAEINLRPWLYTIVRNRALNALRDEPVHEHLDENFDGVLQPPDVAAHREELAALIAGVRELPAPQREALVRRELEGRSHEKIAASLGTTPGAVRGLIYRARTALRDGMGLLIPLPVLRAILGSGAASSDAAGAGGAAAAGLAAGGGGIAMKVGATLGIAVIAVGSGIAIQHRGSRSDETQAASGAHVRQGAAERAAGSGPARIGSGLLADSGRGRGGPGRGSDDSGRRGEDSGPSSSSGPGHSGHDSSGEGSSGSGETAHSGSSGSGGSGDSSGSGSGTSDGGGGSGISGSGDGGSGSSGSGSGGDDATMATDDGSGGSGVSGSGDATTTTTTTSDGGGEGPG
jgi:RNA polymerase sigma factor (sigma-70 family)